VFLIVSHLSCLYFGFTVGFSCGFVKSIFEIKIRSPDSITEDGFQGFQDSKKKKGPECKFRINLQELQEKLNNNSNKDKK